MFQRILYVMTSALMAMLMTFVPLTDALSEVNDSQLSTTASMDKQLEDKNDASLRVDVSFAYEDDAYTAWNDAFIVWVTEVDRENGEVKGLVLKSNSAMREGKGFNQEMSLFKPDIRIPFSWRNLSLDGMNAAFGGETVFVEPGDVIANCATDKWHSIVAKQVEGMQFELTYVKTPEQPYQDDVEGYGLIVTREDQEEARDVVYHVIIDGESYGTLGPGESLFASVSNAEPTIIVRHFDEGKGYPGRETVLSLWDGVCAGYSFALNEQGSMASQSIKNADCIEDSALSWN